jgi:hypothetical protein
VSEKCLKYKFDNIKKIFNTPANDREWKDLFHSMTKQTPMGDTLSTFVWAVAAWGMI